jgi:hypothetical protein
MIYLPGAIWTATHLDCRNPANAFVMTHATQSHPTVREIVPRTVG